jgi:hypothetical protein
MTHHHPDTTIVGTRPCPLCGRVGRILVSTAELQTWIDADGAMPFMAAFPSLGDADHIRLATGIHEDCDGLDEQAS